MDRRDFLRWSTGMGVAALFGMRGLTGCTGDKKSSPSLSPPALPYPTQGLEPHISQKTVELHYGKHHRGYIEQTAKRISGTAYQGLPLERIVVESAARSDQQALFNHAAQAYNHAFYWQSLSPTGGGQPQGAVKAAIDKDLGGYDRFRQELTQAALTQFGSGWAWLVRDQSGRLKITQTANADTPMVHGMTPLWTIDVWEHAYYLDYQNRRADYVEAVLNHLINWDHIARGMA